MKFTSEQLIEAMGLREEDVILCQDKEYIIKENKLISKDERDGIGLEIILGIDYLLDKDFEIIRQVRRIGDLICKDTDCKVCPLHCMDCKGNFSNSLYYNLDEIFKGIEDSELYNILKARLDKEFEFKVVKK